MNTNTDDTEMTFSYSGWGQNVCVSLQNDDADFLPKVMDNFASFLRAAGFVYLGVRKEGKSYVFHHQYKWEDMSCAEEADDDILSALDDAEQEEVNKAADDYWDKAVRDALYDHFSRGDIVFYNGRGQPDEQHGHGGYKSVTLLNMKGKLIDHQDSPVGRRALVKWDNWFDGHNGMGSDPEAKVSEKSYWWTDIDNLSLSN